MLQYIYTEIKYCILHWITKTQEIGDNYLIFCGKSFPLNCYLNLWILKETLPCWSPKRPLQAHPALACSKRQLLFCLFFFHSSFYSWDEFDKHYLFACCVHISLNLAGTYLIRYLHVMIQCTSLQRLFLLQCILSPLFFFPDRVWQPIENGSHQLGTTDLKCLEMTIVVIWRYINKTELNWIEWEGMGDSTAL